MKLSIQWVKSSNGAFDGQEVQIVPGGTAKLPTNDSVSTIQEFLRAPHVALETYLVQALVLAKAAQRYGVAAALQQPHTLGGKSTSVFQYEVAFTEGLSCGGAYMKLVAQPEAGAWSPSDLTPDTPYSVMFGPDLCGSTNKVHLILKVRSPVNGDWKEHHLKDAPAAVGVADSHTHLYALALGDDNTYSISVDGKSIASGSVFDEGAFEPPLQPPAVIPDPADSKPADWVDDAKIPDPEASKPDGWDEDAPRTIPDETAKKPEGWLDDAAAQIPDPDAEQPEDWDEEEDGEWEAPTVSNPACEEAPGCGPWVRPTIKNPEYKGKWKAPVIENPEYVGEWRPREITNPATFKSKGVADLAPVVGVAIEVWTMSAGMQFDNILLTADAQAAAQWVADTWVLENAAQVAASSNAQASARAAARADAWASGDYGQVLLLSMSSLVETAMQNMLVTGLTVALLLGLLMYGCFACCGGEDVEGEGDEGRRAMAQAFAKMQEGGEEDMPQGASDSDSDADAGAGVVHRSTAGGVEAADEDADQVQGGSDDEGEASAEKQE